MGGAERAAAESRRDLGQLQRADGRAGSCISYTPHASSTPRSNAHLRQRVGHDLRDAAARQVKVDQVVGRVEEAEVDGLI